MVVIVTESLDISQPQAKQIVDESDEEDSESESQDKLVSAYLQGADSSDKAKSQTGPN